MEVNWNEKRERPGGGGSTRCIMHRVHTSKFDCNCFAINIDCLVILIVDAMVLAWRAHHCGFCTLGCGPLFGLWSFPFSSLVPLLGVFPLVIYYISW